MGTGAASASVPVHNTGLVDVQAGSLSLGSGSSNAGTIQIATGATVDVVQGGTFTLSAGGVTTGGGALQVGPLATLNVAQDSAVGNLSLTGRTFSGTPGGGKLINTGTLTLDGSSLTVTGRQVDNSGTATLANAVTLTLAGGAVWNNQAGGTFDFLGDSPINNGTGTGQRFDNAGLVRKSGGVGTSTFGVAFNNTGTTRVGSGTLNLNRGGSSGGVFDLTGTTAVLAVSSGYALQAGASSTGPGTVRVTTFNTLTVAGSASLARLSVAGGTLNVNAPLAVQQMTLANGVVDGTDTLTLDALTWTNGTMRGTGRTVLNGATALAPATFATVAIDTRTFENNGAVTWTGNANLTLLNGAVWNNNAGALFVAQGDGGLLGGQFNNAGTVRKSGGTGTTNLNVTLTNTGTVEALAGTLRIGGGSGTGSSSGTFRAGSGGTISFEGGTHTLVAAAPRGRC